MSALVADLGGARRWYGLLSPAVATEGGRQFQRVDWRASGQRIAEGVATNLVTAAIIWLVAAWLGLVENAALTTMAFTVAIISIAWTTFGFFKPMFDRRGWSRWVSFAIEMAMGILLIIGILRGLTL